MKNRSSASIFMVPNALLVLLATLLPTSSSQFIYPPPLPSSVSLSDYTSGKAQPIRDYIIHDAIIGSFRTPKPAFSITRCAKEGRTEPILPSSDIFNSSQGHIAADGTWQWMDSWDDSAFPHVYNKGKNLWIIPDFDWYVGNATTGRICWWELYSVSERRVQTPFDPVTGESSVIPEITLLGDDQENYFASVPFIVNTTMRAGNRNYTWGSGGGRDNRASSTTISVSNQPTGNSAVGYPHRRAQQTSVLYSAFTVLGLFLGLGV